ncbi:energy transducer TonB [Aggregatibacter actinomycetemcomitans]|uniref:energy transducer TonB n=1 Tax=Aggregatibacter actinomycetemcomitans TaxID=714 RepID=UPI000360A35E|nr:energy transducer TonB [Aggregatibacter actinomycetemcomitans]MCE3056692.1 energy transducer TonB [Aggregatibacter actinomycetemcomitans]TYB28109.1 energy transducer TonB [Aggregatibacter actinomycetemcomitans]
MQTAKRSLLSLLLSLLIHAVIVYLLFWSHVKKSDFSANSVVGELSTSISMEMLMAQVEAEPPPVEEKAPEPEKQETVDDPTVKPEPPKVEKPKEPEKPKEKPKENPKEKPKEKPKQKPRTDVPVGDKTVDSNASVNSKATSTGPVTTNNPNLAGSGASSDERNAYLSAIRREIEKHKRYPTRAKMMRKQGIVTVSFSIGADGSISGASIVKSSGAEDLDNAALSAVNSARSIGPRPAGISSSISVPISFKIN